VLSALFRVQVLEFSFSIGGRLVTSTYVRLLLKALRDAWLHAFLEVEWIEVILVCSPICKLSI